MASFSVLSALAAIQNGDARQLKDGLESLSTEQRAQVLSEASGGASLLHYAAESGHESSVRVLLACGHRVDEKESQGATPLMWAAGEGNRVVIALLLEHAASPIAVDALQETPLHWAALNGHVEAARLIVEAGSQLNHRPGSNAVFLVDAKNASGATPLHNATINKHGACVRYLIEVGADVNIKNGQGESPLSLAESFRDAELLRSFDAEARGLLTEIERVQERAKMAEERENKTREAHQNTQVELVRVQATLDVAVKDLEEERAAHQASRSLLADMRTIASELEVKLDSLVNSLDHLREENKKLQLEVESKERQLFEQQQQQQQQQQPLRLRDDDMVRHSQSAQSTAEAPSPAMMLKLVELQQILGQCALQISSVQQQYFSQ